MIPFVKLNQATCAPLPINEIDTDVIYPSRFLGTTKRTGLSSLLFYDLRRGKPVEGELEKPPFILDLQAYQNTQIMVVGDHFGCGSSREHAPWALLDFGIRCLISTRFGDIFFGNCFKNGILCITLPQEQVDYLMGLAQKQQKLSIDLPEQKIIPPEGESIPFDIDPYLKTTLIQGLDEIELTLRKEEKITEFETLHYTQFPWLNSKSL